MKTQGTLTLEADDRTIKYYNHNGEKYAAKTLNLQLSGQWTEFSTYIKPKGKILDIGCGSGRDMIKFQQLGFMTEGIEPSHAMAKIARQNSGSIVHEIPVEKMAFQNKFDGVWACASLLHVHEKNILPVIEIILNSLKINGYFYFSLKHGCGQTRHDDDRLFVYYNEHTIRKITDQLNYIKVVRIWTTEDSAKRPDDLWLNCIVKKSQPEK